jgi:hypothetical protein
LIVVIPDKESVLFKCFPWNVEALPGLILVGNVTPTHFKCLDETIEAASSEAYSIDCLCPERGLVVAVIGLGIPCLLIFIMDFLFLCSSML